MDISERLQKRSEQLQLLGAAIALLEKIDLEDIVKITDGSRLGKIAKLLNEVKTSLGDIQIEDRLNQNLLTIDKAMPKSSSKSRETVSKNALVPALVVSRGTGSKNIKSAKPQEPIRQVAVSSAQQNAIIMDYLQQVFSDTETFPSRKSINEFFKDYFEIDYNLNKKSRVETIKRLCRLLLKKQDNRVVIGDILLKATNSKHGAFLKADDTVFLNSVRRYPGR
ncbi:hypothetical protein [Pseudanabaena sp. PCC 6802]|uniref:hypothetical protein n=1 Tax=Pseudanabaena sp. PCC 6802 TaxID=118173 RepID=UPI00035DEAEA|nr:hypothetical protein [Pseudanabaena sp. PCC 6802]